jgi:hypothetical protein
MTEPEALAPDASSRVTVEIIGDPQFQASIAAATSAFAPAAKAAKEAVERMEETAAPALTAAQAAAQAARAAGLTFALSEQEVEKMKARWATERLNERRLMARRMQLQNGRGIRRARQSCAGRRPGGRRVTSRSSAASGDSSDSDGPGEAGHVVLLAGSDRRLSDSLSRTGAVVI